MNKFLFFLILILIALGAAFFVGRNSVSQVDEKVSSRIILNSIQDQAFLVTKTLYLDEETTITIEDAGGLKGLLFGKELKARALVRSDVGVDLKKMTEENINIDSSKNIITIKLPEATILTSGISGNVEVESSRGIWTSVKELFTNESNDDYNRAVNELVSNAENAVRARTDVFDSARADTVKLISWMIEHTASEYRVEVVQ